MNSTQNTGEGWHELLDALTDEELDQYGRMAIDQVRLEVRWAWLQVILVALGLALAGWTVVKTLEIGFDRTRFFSFALAGALLYWPYRSARTRALWKGHNNLVRRELARRQSARSNSE